MLTDDNLFADPAELIIQTDPDMLRHPLDDAAAAELPDVVSASLIRIQIRFDRHDCHNALSVLQHRHDDVLSELGWALIQVRAHQKTLIQHRRDVFEVFVVVANPNVSKFYPSSVDSDLRENWSDHPLCVVDEHSGSFRAVTVGHHPTERKNWIFIGLTGEGVPCVFEPIH